MAGWRGKIWLLFALLMPGAVLADMSMMASRGSIFGARAPMFDAAPRVGAPTSSVHSASLFIDSPDAGLFAALPDEIPRIQVPTGAIETIDTGDPISRLRTIIASAEAGRMGYDAVQHGARIKTPKPPTQMTLEEIVHWIRATPGQPHAIGRYQFIPKTLGRLVRKIGAEGYMRFSPQLQDRLADELLKEAGLMAFQDGMMSRKTFMYNLSKIWAGLPTSSGKSYYQGYAGNKATMTYAKFDAEMARIFPG